jgi:antitoxin HigA-1
VINDHAAVTADMDLRLSEALGTNPGYWLTLQTQKDLWNAMQAAKRRKRIQSVQAPVLTTR